MGWNDITAYIIEIQTLAAPMELDTQKEACTTTWKKTKLQLLLNPKDNCNKKKSMFLYHFMIDFPCFNGNDDKTDYFDDDNQTLC